MTDKDLEISDNLPNLNSLILEEEIELVSLELYNVFRAMTERGYIGESSNLRKGLHGTPGREES